MNVSEIISDQIKPLLVTDTGERALLKLHEYNVSQLPVIQDRKYCGLVTMDEILTLPHLNDPLSLLTLQRPYVHDHVHIYELMKAAVQTKARIMPIISAQDETYLGVVTAEGCMKAFATLHSITEDGGLIELDIPVKDFQLSEIARIAESEGVTILSHYSQLDVEASMVTVSLKLNQTDLAVLIASYERHEYEVRGIYQEKQHTQNEQERYEAFMKYLNV
jgi:acetoin utilization protein AcuB